MQTAMQNLPAPPDFRHSPSIDQVGAQELAGRFMRRSIKKDAKIQGLKMALNMIDLTTLEGMDTPGKVRQMCYKAQHMHDALPGLPTTAAVCVYPTFVRVAKQALQNSPVKVASVATAFPSGHSRQDLRTEEVRFAVEEGADEVDMVINRGRLLCGEYNAVYDEIAQTKAACGPARLKVILETGEIGTLDRIRRASDIAMYAGADFIKTSTGKISPAATMPVTLVMLQAIKDFYYKHNIMIGMKPAGGISTAKQSLQYLVMLREVLGEAWLDNKWFRFGASRLANDIVLQLLKQETGKYQSMDYISQD